MGNVTEFDGKEFVAVTASDLKLGDLADKEEEKRTQEAEKRA